MPKTARLRKGPAEKGLENLQIAEGEGWKACYDEARELYTGETNWAGYYDLYEIDKEIYNRLITERMSRRDAQRLIIMGRHLYKSVSDRNSSYDVILDEDYAELCPWADIQKTGEAWGAELTDLAVAIFDSEKQNREQRGQRREKREERVKKDPLR